MNRHAGDARVGFRSPRPRENIGDRLAHRAFAGEVEPDAADFGFVDDIRRQDLRHDGRSLGQQRGRDGGGFIGIAGKQRGRDRNGIGREQPRDLDRIEPGASIVAPPVSTIARAAATSGLKSCGRLGGVAINRFQRLAVAYQVHEASDRIGFGRVVRNASGFEDGRGGIAASDPHGENGLRPDQAAAMRLRDGGDRFCRGLRRSERGRNIHDQDGIVLQDPRAAPRTRRCSGRHRHRRRCRRDSRATRLAAARRRAVCIVSGEMPARVPPRSASRSTASTPIPPPLVRMASRLPGNGRTRPERLRRGKQLIQIEYPQADRRGETRRRRPHRHRRARRCASAPPWRLAHDGRT